MTDALHLFPQPRHMTMTGGVFELPAERLILLDGADPQALHFTLTRLQRVLADQAGVQWPAVASWAVPASQVGLTVRINAQHPVQPQGYELDIAPAGITISAHDEAGAFYGACTLGQILGSALGRTQAVGGRTLPCLHIGDWPDFPARGVMLDVSRDKVPTMETILSLIDMLAGWKINQVQLYTEHTFAYRNHPEVWAQASPFTGQDMLTLDAYCRERHVELVPNQNSFGHMTRWLTHDRYVSLAELTGTFQTPWGGRTMEGPFSLCPIDPGSIDLIRGLYDELLPHFTSRMFNVGCDETIDVGQGRSKEAVATQGPGRVYLDYLLKVYREVKAHGRTMQFWGDIIIQHPELIGELPKDAIALEWGYEADHPFDAHGAQFAAAGVPFYVCPGTASWCSIAGRTENALGNLLNAAENGIKHGAVGYLNTDWGDAGHWQFLPMSYLGFAAGAAYSWALEANRPVDMAAATSLHAFGDPSGTMGRLAYDLGNVYKAGGLVPPNSSILFQAMQTPLPMIQAQAAQYGLTRAAFDCAAEAIDAAMAPLSSVRMAVPDAGLIKREFMNTARLLRHACRRGLMGVGALEASEAPALAADLGEIIGEYRPLWLARNRPGGLADSVARFEKARADYSR
jgi:hexosaminidase